MIYGFDNVISLIIYFIYLLILVVRQRILGKVTLISTLAKNLMIEKTRKDVLISNAGGKPQRLISKKNHVGNENPVPKVSLAGFEPGS